MIRPIVHRCPPRGEGLTPCCGKNPLGISRIHRITTHDHLVTCNKPADFDPYANDPRVTRHQDDLSGIEHDGRVIDVVQLANGNWVRVEKTRRLAEVSADEFTKIINTLPPHPTREIAIHSLIGAPQS